MADFAVPARERPVLAVRGAEAVFPLRGAYDAMDNAVAHGV